MTTIISDAGVQFAGGNIVDIRSAVPTTGSYTQGDVVIEKSTNSELAGWKRLTTGSAHVLGTDWLYFGAMGVGQTWQNVTGSRTSGTTYYNTTGRPISLSMYNSSAGSVATAKITVNGIDVSFAQFSVSAALGAMSINAIVPPEASYVYTDGGTGCTKIELR